VNTSDLSTALVQPRRLVLLHSAPHIDLSRSSRPQAAATAQAESVPKVPRSTTVDGCGVPRWKKYIDTSTGTQFYHIAVSNAIDTSSADPATGQAIHMPYPYWHVGSNDDFIPGILIQTVRWDQTSSFAPVNT
jgi:hypothetical protein